MTRRTAALFRSRRRAEVDGNGPIGVVPNFAARRLVHSLARFADANRNVDLR